MVIKGTQKREPKKEPNIGATKAHRQNAKSRNNAKPQPQPDDGPIRYEPHIEVVSSFNYLGGIDSADGRMQSEIDRRTQRMRARYFRLAGRVFENTRI